MRSTTARATVPRIPLRTISRTPSTVYRNSMRLGLLLAVLLGATTAASSRPPPPGSDRFYEQRVRPLLEQRCYACHSSRASRPQGGLLLDQESGWRRGGVSGPVIAPG